MSGTGQGPRASAGTRALLETGDLKLLGLLRGASNYTFLGEARLGHEVALVVYKPRDGETPLWDFPPGSLCAREVAASLVAEALGWPNVPPTVLRDGPHGPGSVQLFIESDPEEHYFTMRPARLRDFRPVALFDAVINNGDRKAGHCLAGLDGLVWLIDHGVSFSVEPKLRSVIWEFAGEPLPPDLCADVSSLAARLGSGAMREAMLALLSQQEVDATKGRAQALARSGRFPSPGGERPYPWPPV